MRDLPAVRVVTDSTACLPGPGDPPTDSLLPAELAPVVVPLHVVTDDTDLREGVDVRAAEVAARIAEGERLTTSQPSTAEFTSVYGDLAAQGARAVVSVHLSGKLSGTAGTAERAGQRAMLPVRVVDSRTAAMGLGFAADEAARCAAAGCDASHVARRAAEVAASARTTFLVDSLDHLRRGGRLSAPAAALGTALGVRPILTLDDGAIELTQRVRTRRASVARLVGLALEQVRAASRPAVAVHHLGAPEQAAEVAAALADRLGFLPVVTPVSAVLGAHVGPGALAVVVVDRGGHVHDLEPGGPW
ncbi:DegV family protein [Isoptericola sp. 178]|uniref:DegV family protein n=1 Tax=Isoptericola sediminis TaxID=2733572 RepID=A0A849KAX3_9MICO|nr:MULTISPECIES: DegV family protein [Isoptericola]MDO8145364.1 DegV family protein [Isoptericola sp. 178]NNU28387.1 DegV family protein [Isoptericola sediminis]